MTNTEQQDVYTRISSLEQGVRPWIQPWNAEYVAGRITRSVRYNGKSYSGINILMLWASGAGAVVHCASLDDVQTGHGNWCSCP